MDATTIRVTPGVRQQLEELKAYPKESFNDIIARLIAAYSDDEPLSDEEVRGIAEAVEDIRAGRLYTLDEVRADIGGEHGRGIPGTVHGTGKAGRKKTSA